MGCEQLNSNEIMMNYDGIVHGYCLVSCATDDFTVYDEYVSALLLEMEELAQLEPHPNVVGLIRVCTVGSE